MHLNPGGRRSVQFVSLRTPSSGDRRQSEAAAEHAPALDGWVRPATRHWRPSTRRTRWAQRTRQVSQWSESDLDRQHVPALCSLPDPLKETKLARIEWLLEHARQRTFAFDEFGSLTIKPVGGSAWSPEGKPQRLRATYHKPHGSRQFFAWYPIGADQLFGNLEPRKGWAPTLRALQAIRASVDDGQPIHVILDNLNHHKNRGVREWCAANDVELVFTTDLPVVGQPDRSPLRAATPVRHRQQRPPQQPRAGASDPQLPALAQQPHPRPQSPRS